MIRHVQYLFCSTQLKILMVLFHGAAVIQQVNGQFLPNLFGRSPVPQYGPYTTSNVNFDLPNLLDITNTEAYVVYPTQIFTSENTKKFPLLIFAHGFQAGDQRTSSFYRDLLNGVASFGFIIIAPRSCNDGCPPPKPNYRFEMLKLLDWVAPSKVGITPTEDSLGITQYIDHTTGYGLFGHSMGGLATVRNLHLANTTLYDIRAGVVLHPAPSNDSLSTNIPLAAYTGTRDQCCGARATKKLYNDATGPKAYANMIGGRHTEPCNTIFGRNDWSTYTAAWFQIYLVDPNSTIAKDAATTSSSYNLIYGTDADSLCGGSIRMRDDCEALL